jgi:Domain of unknown function (DUF1830)
VGGLNGPLAVNLVSCGYRNSSDRMVIARCLGPDCFFLERVVFPFELLSFQCPDDSELEIWTHGLGGAELVETIPVSDLLIEPERSRVMNLEAQPTAQIDSAA